MGKLNFDNLSLFLSYEPETGDLRWKAQDAKSAQWNGRFAGRPAFTAKNGSGYRHGTVMGRTVSAHRVIWLLHTGHWPEGHIDHVNMIRDDNRWKNLRLATHAQNMRNTRSRRGASSSFIGVGFHKATGKWAARIRVHDKQKHIGVFQSEIDAAHAYDSEARKLSDPFVRLNFEGS